MCELHLDRQHPVVGTFDDQIHLVIAGFCVLVQVFWLITSDTPDKGICFWLITLASIALAVGAVLRMQESPSPAGGSAPLRFGDVGGELVPFAHQRAQIGEVSD